MVMGVAAAEVAVGLAILIAVFRGRKTVDAGDLRSLQG
ncbi:MAG TPA: NADH-quinone oxidoreductase subunit K [Planctomycetota bacterium]|nr:NADH-quinone oxidoreductase subunit K [Planctomycetota bacterium]